MKEKTLGSRNVRVHTIRRWKAARLLLDITLRLAIAVAVYIFIALPYISKLLTSTLNKQGVEIARDYPQARLTWSINPPGMTISNIHLLFRNKSEDIPAIIELHIDSIQYRIEGARLQATVDPVITLPVNGYVSGFSISPWAYMVRFLTISWKNCTILVHDHHPQPRVALIEGKLQLSSLSLNSQIQGRLSLPQEPFISRSQSIKLQLSIGKIAITTHTVTSIPIPIAHPTIKGLINRFPAFFNMFTKPATYMPDSAANENPIFYPPHLSLFAPSLIFPALYQGISPFRQLHLDDYSRKATGDHTYDIPTPFPHISLRFQFSRHNVRRMRQMSLTLIDMGENPRLCAPIQVGQIKAVEISGRDADGKGGCCTFRMQDAGTLPQSTGYGIDTASTPAANFHLNRILKWIIDQLGHCISLVSHPFYLAIYTSRLKSLFLEGDTMDLCAVQEVINYHIGELEWIDKTPKTTSTVARALVQVHGGFLNLFEDVVALVS